MSLNLVFNRSEELVAAQRVRVRQEHRVRVESMMGTHEEVTGLYSGSRTRKEQAMSFCSGFAFSTPYALLKNNALSRHTPFAYARSFLGG